MKLSEHEIFKYVTQHIADPRLWAIALDLQILLDGHEAENEAWDITNKTLWEKIAQLETELRNTQIRIEARDTKLANQAIVITKLEQSRKGLTVILQDSE